MQRRKSNGNADWYFFICISNNRLGAGKCTGMYIREPDIMEAIKAEIDRYVENHKDITLDYDRDKTALRKKLAMAKRNFDIRIEQFQYSFEQNTFGNASLKKNLSMLLLKREPLKKKLKPLKPILND